MRLAKKKTISYDYLVIATGSDIHPEETPGLMDGGWRQNVFDFYTLDGAMALSRFLKFWKGGRLVLNVAEMPIKCPVAPLEFSLSADWFFHQRGIREQVEIVFATPCPARSPSHGLRPSWAACWKERASTSNRISISWRWIRPNRSPVPMMKKRLRMIYWSASPSIRARR